MRVAVVEFLASSILLVVPAISGLFGVILTRFFRMNRTVSTRVIVMAIVLGTPSPVVGGSYLKLQPAFLVLLKWLNGVNITAFNLLSAIFCIALLTLVSLVGQRYMRE